MLITSIFVSGFTRELRGVTSSRGLCFSSRHLCDWNSRIGIRWVSLNYLLTFLDLMAGCFFGIPQAMTVTKYLLSKEGLRAETLLEATHFGVI